MSETVLWTNPSPNDNFASQTVASDQSIANFDYIGIYFKRYKNDSDSVLSLMSVTDFNKSDYRMGMSATYSNVAYCKSGQKHDDTSIAFNSTYEFSSSTRNNACIVPIKIVGLKY